MAEVRGPGDPSCGYRVKQVKIGLKGPGGVGRLLAEHESAVCPGGHEGQQHPGLYQEQCEYPDDNSIAPEIGTDKRNGFAYPWGFRVKVLTGAAQ
ncbi:hypothetical protein llap_10331 [Limosa lapponica baueri]|uniref:Uncharacterized protein n=1 Tax=Limosa lapponica baueri TaxID=1758121 RepID=A0A2I0TZW3_LIMLA|nr:hypothetical protein llap_10331 [Limosa lapponica baueri]